MVVVVKGELLLKRTEADSTRAPGTTLPSVARVIGIPVVIIAVWLGTLCLLALAHSLLVFPKVLHIPLLCLTIDGALILQNYSGQRPLQCRRRRAIGIHWMSLRVLWWRHEIGSLRSR